MNAAVETLKGKILSGQISINTARKRAGLPGFLITGNTLSDECARRLKDQWEPDYSGDSGSVAPSLSGESGS